MTLLFLKIDNRMSKEKIDVVIKLAFVIVKLSGIISLADTLPISEIFNKLD